MHNDRIRFGCLVLFVAALSFTAGTQEVLACSTVKLQSGNALVYGHNLNNNGSDVPGLAFINKRGVFKIGRTWSELINRDRTNPSTLSWIARYGSVTFNTFGKDLPDGGLNEAGLYIWEMGLGGAEVDYPRNSALPKLNQMNWMQYVLDNCATIGEAVQCAQEIELDGWGWHFFVGDVAGACASIDFVDGRVVVHQGETMPVPGLFNAPYAREIELSRYFKGFGGQYEPALDDPNVPRYVKTAVMLSRYDPQQDAVDYGFEILNRLFVTEVADWSVICDVRNQTVHFKTSRNRQIKRFALDAFDFSNAGPTLVLDIDIAEGGDVASRFSPFSCEKMARFIGTLPLPDAFCTMGGLTKAEFVTRLATHSTPAQDRGNQPFAGLWQVEPESPGAKPRWEIDLRAREDAVLGEITDSEGLADHAPIDHVHLIGNRLVFTFQSDQGRRLMEVKAFIEGEQMTMQLGAIEGSGHNFALRRQPADR